MKRLPAAPSRDHSSEVGTLVPVVSVGRRDSRTVETRGTIMDKGTNAPLTGRSAWQEYQAAKAAARARPPSGFFENFNMMLGVLIMLAVVALLAFVVIGGLISYAANGGGTTPEELRQTAGWCTTNGGVWHQTGSDYVTDGFCTIP